jgi:CspA family cold shock protein
MEEVTGVVVWWNSEEGWGALRSPSVPSDVFAHFSNLEMDGYHDPQAGQGVEFLVESYPPGQDGYFYRAENVRIIA